MLTEILSDIRYRLRALFRRAAVEKELDQELRFHLEREAEKHVREGLSPEEAMHLARVAFGGVDSVKEASRDGRGLREADQVHRVYLIWDDRGREVVKTTNQYTRYLDLRRWTTTFSDLAGYSNRSLPVGVGQGAREMEVATVSATLFDFFDAKPVISRFFTAAEDTVSEQLLPHRGHLRHRGSACRRVAAGQRDGQRQDEASASHARVSTKQD
jgi:hypothetical protein